MASSLFPHNLHLLSILLLFAGSFSLRFAVAYVTISCSSIANIYPSMYELRLDFFSHALDNEWSKSVFSFTTLLLYPCVSFDCHLFRWSSFSLFLTFWLSCLVSRSSSSISNECLSSIQSSFSAHVHILYSVIHLSPSFG